jgi:NAD(P)-dependent dehydrogenase (short-subunit alcohol dehydrogenase family)
MGIRYIFFHDYEWESGRTNDRNIIVILFRKFDLVHHRYVSRFRFRARTRRVWRIGCLPGWGIYNATKFAVEGLSEALAAEAAPLGIKVTVVEPVLSEPIFSEVR